MKIIFLQNVLFDYRVPFYNYLVDKGYQITVVHSGDKNNLPCSFEQMIVEKRKLGPFIFQRNTPDFSQYDVVISMFDLHWITNILPVFYKRKYRFLFWGHGFGKSFSGNIFRKHLINQCDGLVLYNEKSKQRILQSGVREEKLFVANNTIAVSNAGRSDCKKTQFLFVGRLQQRKRVDIFIRAFALALKSVKTKEQFSIAIIGDGEERLFLEKLSQTLEVEKHCHFLGKITDDDCLKEQFDHSVAYVSPGPMGLGVNHAFAYGVPTLSNLVCKHGPETWILNKDNSLWINSEDEQEQIDLFSRQMVNLMDNPSQAEKLSYQAYKDYVSKCSIDVMLDGFCNAINKEKL